MTSPHSIRDVVAQMIAVVPEDALSDLQDEDPASAVEVHFEPVRVHQLPRASIRGEDCSVDGYYEVFIDPDRPRILYSNDVVPERARFTIIHELGHHIFNTTGAWLLDDLDRIGGSALGAHRAEEAACHRFAGEVLVPTGLLDDIVGSDALTPKHVVWLRETTNASWEALAVRAANYSGTTTAVALVRSGGCFAGRGAGGRTAADDRDLDRGRAEPADARGAAVGHAGDDSGAAGAARGPGAADRRGQDQ